MKTYRNYVATWVMLFLACLASLLFGAGTLELGQAFAVLTGQGTEDARFVVMELRLPRLVIGMATGLALGVAGALLQTLTRNPLAEPGLLGVSAGSAFAVSLAILLGASTATLTTLISQVGALAGCGLVVAATRIQGAGQDPVRLVLAGATLTGLLLSLSSLLMLIDQRAADEIRFWITGSLAGKRWDQLTATMPSLLLAGAIVVGVARPLASLALGEKVAMGLGHKPGLIRLMVIVAVALLVGGATALAGPLVFVGLVVPFVARSLAGADIRKTLWLCLPIGPAMIIAADTLSRLLVTPSEMPLGVITAVIGAPVLMVIIRARRIPAL
ncbi:FecCD family ABC transporter permease [Marinobacter salexigens]|uniref:Iron ABC transporter permease n=1 Tax=Marinobacter salexigens TaxID=1925763 RepID=A0ABS6ADV1_9GAMM|nr:iron ABC transporter permease [Marinobacter salexigens]MBU2875660.1 iron ABC transporter permease [Marinobacter salexigens]